MINKVISFNYHNYIIMKNAISVYLIRLSYYSSYKCRFLKEKHKINGNQKIKFIKNPNYSVSLLKCFKPFIFIYLSLLVQIYEFCNLTRISSICYSIRLVKSR